MCSRLSGIAIGMVALMAVGCSERNQPLLPTSSMQAAAPVGGITCDFKSLNQFATHYFSAQEAKDMGLVHHMVPAADLERFTREYCAQIAANAPLTMRAAKRIVREVMKKDYDAALCKTWVRECFESEDYAEGRKAFMEKRKAVFKGK